MDAIIRLDANKQTEEPYGPGPQICCFSWTDRGGLNERYAFDNWKVSTSCKERAVRLDRFAEVTWVIQQNAFGKSDLVEYAARR